MSKKSINKDAQNSFLKLDLSEKINLLNETIALNGTTDSISKNLGFSYSWVTKIMEKENVYYVATLKRFIIQKNDMSISNEEVAILKEIIKDYQSINNFNKDIRSVAGICGNESITRSVVIDKEINNEWNKFCKKNSFISNKDLVTSALKLFMDKYNK
ncbi:hypothetical protein ACEE95_06935 [Clostridium baratii]